MKTQGLCQGSGAAPSGWAVVSIVILNAHKAESHGATFHCPITKSTLHLVAILFVDDIDLIHIDLENLETLEDTHEALQRSVHSWGSKLIVSGGALKPSKCFYYLFDYEWTEDGVWKYRELDEDDLIQYELWVPTPSGQNVAIEYLDVDAARKTLGSMTCPFGDCTAAISRMQEQAHGWIDDVRNGSLHRRQFWLKLKIQFWPWVAFGLGCCTAPLQELETAFQKAYYKILPMGGIICSAPRDLRSLDTGFAGIGCPHVGVECMIEQLNKFAMHYGCQTGVGIALQTLMEFFLLELGLTASAPFSFSFPKYGGMVTYCWLRTLWEKWDRYKIQVVLKNVKIQPPREGDKWFNQALIDEGYSAEEIGQLNKVRIYQQVLYLLDVLNANGRLVDLKYASDREGC
jgi:hypothetical protein